MSLETSFRVRSESEIEFDRAERVRAAEKRNLAATLARFDREEREAEVSGPILAALFACDVTVDEAFSQYDAEIATYVGVQTSTQGEIK
jgi:hypothetical protein